MKLRLRANTIRLRMLKGEVERLAEGEKIVETLPTPNPFHFCVAATGVAELTADFKGDTLTVEVPLEWARNWAASEEVGRTVSTNGVDILIEKDWHCTTPRFSEDNDGTYPNPTALR